MAACIQILLTSVLFIIIFNSLSIILICYIFVIIYKIFLLFFLNVVVILMHADIFPVKAQYLKLTHKERCRNSHISPWWMRPVRSQWSLSTGYLVSFTTGAQQPWRNTFSAWYFMTEGPRLQPVWLQFISHEKILGAFCMKIILHFFFSPNPLFFRKGKYSVL